MCRISGILDRSQSRDHMRGVVKKMCNLLEHGGPDGEGIYVSEEAHLVFGHRRLALIDLSPSGRQPMEYEKGRYHITYNGELYNYRELRKQLTNSGYIFNTNSDTEVVLASFAAWGTKAFDRFNGMFAFALWDEFEKKLYLVRDASGIKPLYYYLADEQLVFASEVRAFKAVPELIVKDDKAKVYLLAYGHIPEPVTTLRNVKMLPKGSMLIFDVSSGKSRIESFTHFSYIEKITDKSSAKKLIKEILQLAVDRHLISDAAIGVFLSGGLDSSIISLLANKSTPGHLNTLSIYFDEKKYSEKKYQDILFQDLTCKSSQYLLKEDNFTNYLPDIFKAMDQPSIDGINTWFISKYAKEAGLKAVLSGLGADELYGGYPSFNRMKKLQLLNLLPDLILKSGKYTISKRFKRLTYLTLKGSKGKYLFLRGQFIPSEIAQQLDGKESEIWDILGEQPDLPNINYLSLPNQASWMEVNLYMQNQLLRDSDVMSMAHGVELRVPFLDKDFVALTLQIASAVKYNGGLPKQLLIDSFKDILPEPIWNRPKMGFSFPFKEWMTHSGYIKDQINSDKGLANSYKKFNSGALHWSQLMTVLVSKTHCNA
jgi:asparagine synthase (glutamine-hydrolysing)